MRVVRHPDGRLEIALSKDGASEPWFRRTYDPRETEEVRLYLYAGTDRVVTEGPAGGPITLRVVAGSGTDTLDDSQSGGTRLYDFEGSRVVKGPGTRVDATAWERRPAKPKETPWLEWRDWGSRTLPQFKGWWEPDPGVMLAAGLARQTWGFRKFPYASLQTVQLQYSIGRSAFKFNYDGEFRRENSKQYFVLDVQASQLENLNYFGLGNELSNTPPEGQTEDYFDVESDVYRFTPWSRWALSRTFEVYVGPEVKWTRTPADQSVYFGVEQPYGTGDFGQVGVRGGFDLDTRGHRMAGTVGDQFRSDGKPALSGVRLKAEGFYYAEAWDATDDFFGVDGRAARLPRRQARDARRASRRAARVGRVPLVRSVVHRRQPEPARVPQEPLRRRFLALRQPRGAAVAVQGPADRARPLGRVRSHGRGPRVPRGRVVGQVARLVRRRDLLPDAHPQHGAARGGRSR